MKNTAISNITCPTSATDCRFPVRARGHDHDQTDSADANIFWAALGFKTPHAHNSWLELTLGVGIVGVAIAAVAWLAAVYRTLRLATSPHAEHVAFCLALLAGSFFENLSEFEFFRPGRLMFALFVAVLVYLGRELTLFRAGSAEARRQPIAATRPIAYATARVSLSRWAQ